MNPDLSQASCLIRIRLRFTKMNTSPQRKCASSEVPLRGGEADHRRSKANRSARYAESTAAVKLREKPKRSSAHGASEDSPATASCEKLTAAFDSLRERESCCRNHVRLTLCLLQTILESGHCLRRLRPTASSRFVFHPAKLVAVDCGIKMGFAVLLQCFEAP